MRINLYYSLFTFVVLLSAQGILHAQESGSGGVPDNDVYYGSPDREEPEAGYISIGEPEGKGIRIQPTPKDSVSARSPAQKTKTILEPGKEGKTQNQGNAADDSILSFNFLYFFIQKYKLQDIID